MSRFERHVEDSRVDRVLRGGVYAALVLAPLPLGSVRPWSVLALELAAAVLGGLALARVIREPRTLSPGARVLLVPVVLLLLIGVLQIAPLPASWVRWVAPSTAEAREALAAIVAPAAVAPASLAPPSTVDALLRLTAYALLGLAAAVGFRDPRSLRGAALCLAACGAFQALYGSAEYLSGHQHILGQPKRHYLDSATGTFVNRNHFAAFLALTLPFALGLWLAETRRWPSGGSWRERLGHMGDARLSRLFFRTAMVGVIWVGVLLSYSRSGLAAALVATAVFALAPGLGRRRAALVLAACLLPVLYLSWLEVRPPGARFAAETAELTSLNGRLPVWRAAVALAPHYPVIGSGYGTFEAAYASRHEVPHGYRWDHAHNDWLQAWIEGGPPAAIACLLLAAGVFLARWARPTRRRDDVWIHRAVLAGCAALVVHAAIDFPLRIPAIAVALACVAGLQASQTRSFGRRVAP